MRILLAVDDSAYSAAATRQLVEQLGSGAAEVRVLHVVEPPAVSVARQIGGYSRELDAVRDAETRRGEELVGRAAAQLASKNLTVTTLVLQGDPRAQILDEAAQWGADLIVLGSHGRTGLGRFLLGSVSEAVARHADCSVEIVRGPAAP